MSQADLAHRCGVKPPSVNDWESGETKSLKGSSLIAAARALKCEPEYITSGRPAPAEPGGKIEPPAGLLVADLLANPAAYPNEVEQLLGALGVADLLAMARTLIDGAQRLSDQLEGLKAGKRAAKAGGALTQGSFASRLAIRAGVYDSAPPQVRQAVDLILDQAQHSRGKKIASLILRQYGNA